jgi:adenylate kinase family enzyme
MADSPQNTCIVLLSGPVAAGKTTLAKGLSSGRAFKRLSTRDAILRRLPSTPRTREALQVAGERLDQLSDGAWVAEEVSSVLRETPSPVGIVVDAVRIRAQIEEVRGVTARPVVHVHLTASPSVLSERYQSKHTRIVEVDDYSMVRKNPTESQVEGLAMYADLVIDTTSVSAGEALRLVLQILHDRC